MWFYKYSGCRVYFFPEKGKNEPEMMFELNFGIYATTYSERLENR